MIFDFNLIADFFSSDLVQKTMIVLLVAYMLAIFLFIRRFPEEMSEEELEHCSKVDFFLLNYKGNVETSSEYLGKVTSYIYTFKLGSLKIVRKYNWTTQNIDHEVFMNEVKVPLSEEISGHYYEIMNKGRM